MALEELLPSEREWDVEITHGPPEMKLAKSVNHLFDEGTREYEPEFDIIVTRTGDIDTTVIDGLQIGPAYKETSEIGRPVIYLRGELEIEFSTENSRSIFPTVEGLYDVRQREGGLLLVEKSSVSTISPYRFK